MSLVHFIKQLEMRSVSSSFSKYLISSTLNASANTPPSIILVSSLNEVTSFPKQAERNSVVTSSGDSGKFLPIADIFPSLDLN